jgi:hypothetical protein
MAEYIVITILICWGLACVLTHVPHVGRWIRKYDLFVLIPEWRFFAPRAGEHDFYLLYRDRNTSGEVSNWHEVHVAGPRRWWNFVWNPHKRASKALFDLSVELSSIIVNQPDGIQLSLPYLSLLTVVSAEQRVARTGQTQFMILMLKRNLSETTSQVLFVSDPHDL